MASSASSDMGKPVAKRQAMFLLWPFSDGRQLFQIAKPENVSIPEKKYLWVSFRFEELPLRIEGLLFYPGRKKSSYSQQVDDFIYVIFKKKQ